MQDDNAGILLKSLPESFGFIALMKDVNNMDQDLLCAHLISEIEQKEPIDSSETQMAQHFQRLG